MVAVTALVERLKALADMTRLKILKLLLDKEYCVCELAEIIAISQPGISQHLRKLKTAGFVTERREGQWVYYKADEGALRGFQTDFSRFLGAALDAIPEMEEELEKARHLDENPVVIACKSRAIASWSDRQRYEIARRCTMKKRPMRVMFLCTGNSCRSQMAEGLANTLEEGKVEAYSSGLEAHGLNPRAVEVMKEIGIDISGNTSDLIDPELLQTMDYVITLCSHAEDHCPLIPPSVKRLHWGLDDPAKAVGTEAEITAKFREVRDDITQKLRRFLSTL